MAALDVDLTLYRVQVGAFARKAVAEKKLQAIRAAGFEDSFLACVDGGKLWRVQVGKTHDRAVAEKQQRLLQAAGFSGFVTRLGGTE